MIWVNDPKIDQICQIGNFYLDRHMKPLNIPDQEQ